LLEQARAQAGGWIDMAAEGEANKELKTHLGTYGAFTGLMKWGAICAIVIAFIVILIIRK
jgi:hypothetical protein